jgi:hypothetical protein
MLMSHLFCVKIVKFCHIFIFWGRVCPPRVLSILYINTNMVSVCSSVCHKTFCVLTLPHNRWQLWQVPCEGQQGGGSKGGGQRGGSRGLGGPAGGNLKTFRTWFSGCAISILKLGFHTRDFTWSRTWNFFGTWFSRHGWGTGGFHSGRSSWVPTSCLNGLLYKNIANYSNLKAITTIIKYYTKIEKKQHWTHLPLDYSLKLKIL